MNNKVATYIGYMWCASSAYMAYRGVHIYAISFLSIGQLWLIATFFIKD